MRNIIKKILREEDGYLDSTEEDWEWANNSLTISPYSTLKEGDLIKVVETSGLDTLLEDCSSAPDTIVLNEEYFIEFIDKNMEREHIICGCEYDYEDDYCREQVISISIGGFWISEDYVKVVLVKENQKHVA